MDQEGASSTHIHTGATRAIHTGTTRAIHTRPNRELITVFMNMSFQVLLGVSKSFELNCKLELIATAIRPTFPPRSINMFPGNSQIQNIYLILSSAKIMVQKYELFWDKKNQSISCTTEKDIFPEKKCTDQKVRLVI